MRSVSGASPLPVITAQFLVRVVGSVSAGHRSPGVVADTILARLDVLQFQARADTGGGEGAAPPTSSTFFTNTHQSSPSHQLGPMETLPALIFFRDHESS